MGESGSGKTTLLNILAALDKPTGGEVMLDGRELAADPGEGAGRLPPGQSGLRVPGLQPAGHLLPAGQHLSAPGAGGQDVPRDGARACSPLARKLGIAELLEKYPYEVSGGQKQRAAVARALITDPRLILADEPTGALDSQVHRRAAAACSRQINREGQTIVMVTHSVKAASHAGRVLFIKDGEVFHQLYRGSATDEELYQKICDTLTVLATGGEQA